MSKLLVEDKEIVVPGTEMSDGMDYLPGDNTFRDGEKIVGMRLGVVNVSGRLIKIVPLSGTYVPKSGDLVIGKIVGVGLGGWRVNIGWPFEANLSVKEATSDFIPKGDDLGKYFDYGDYLMSQIVNIASVKLIDLSMKGPGLRKLSSGRILNVSSAKVPRIIGKQGSMVGMIKDHTGCRVSVGQNGVIWLSGDDPRKELLALECINKIEKESHVPGLTERIKEFLESHKNGL